MLTLENVTKRFGNLTVLNDVSVHVPREEILGIAGPNGAGKSTLLNACTGSLRICSGKIHLDDRKLDGLTPDRASRLGVARTFQIPQVFGSLSIAENVDTGAWFGQPKLSAKQRKEHVREVMELTGLSDQPGKPARSADLLTRKQVMLAAALASKPTVVFMDEPFGGLNEAEIDAYSELIHRLKCTMKLTFIIVEHKMRALSQLSNRIMILNFGSVLKIGSAKDVLSDAQVIEIYLGAPIRAQG